MTINNPQVKRRDLLKAGVAASAAMTVGIPPVSYTHLTLPTIA